MGTSLTTCARALALLAISASWLALGSARLAHADTDTLCVIVRSASKERALDLSKVRRIFLHEATDDADGHRFIPFNAPPHSPERSAFDRAVLSMGREAVAQHWVDQRIRGVAAPRSMPRVDLTARLVARLPGAIAYVRQSQVTPEVRVLRIDGRLPGEPGYPLP
jgi:hypothetical protein